MPDTDTYQGDKFNVTASGGEWAIWRFVNSDGERETLILDAEGMDELRDYFAEFYAADRAEIAEVREP